MTYARRLDFFETPDYDYMRSLFNGLMVTNGWQCDGQFDWIGRQSVRSIPFAYFYLDIFGVLSCSTIEHFSIIY